MKKTNDKVWSRTYNPNNVTAKPENNPPAGNKTEDLVTAIPSPTPQPPMSSDEDEKDINK